MRKKLYLLIPAVVVAVLTFLFPRSSCDSVAVSPPPFCDVYSGFPIWYTTSDYGGSSSVIPIAILLLDIIIWYGIFYLIMLLFKRIRK